MIKIVRQASAPLNKKTKSYPLHELQVGDGLDLPDDMGNYGNGRSRREVSVRNSVGFFRKRNPDHRFEIGWHPRKENVIRVVRIA